MGIPGLIQCIGPGDRVSLARLAVDHLQRTSRPFRVAIDISIWLFQVQAGKGGANPELRTLFYRLVRLVGLPIHPLFVFDGPQKPLYKRGKVVGRNNGGGGPSALIRRSKRLIELFRFPHHTAPGEAEAECAKLQTSGIVDAVMSDDVDAIMFGSKVTIMNFSRETSSGINAATHVTLYQTEDGEDGHKTNVHFDRDGMILFALLSGGDYLPAGVPKCGPKLAGEIARAGFGKELIQASEVNKTDVDIELGKWRERLQLELEENKEGYFKSKHKAVRIPETFPNLKTLHDYTHPVVSSPERLREAQRSFIWDQAIDIEGLRDFVYNDLGWSNRSNKRLIKVLAAPLVSCKLRLGLPLLANPDRLPPHEIPSGARLLGQRTHYSTDGALELRLEFVPADIVGLDLDSDSVVAELAEESEAEGFDTLELEEDAAEPNPDTRRRQSYDPTQKERVWVFEALAAMGIPDGVDSWHARQQQKRAAAEKRNARKRAPKVAKPKVVDPKMGFGEILKYGKIVKSPRAGPVETRLTSSQKTTSGNMPHAGYAPDEYSRPSSSQPIISRSGEAYQPETGEKFNSFSQPSPLKAATSSDLEAAMNFDYDEECQIGKTANASRSSSISVSSTGPRTRSRKKEADVATSAATVTATTSQVQMRSGRKRIPVSSLAKSQSLDAEGEGKQTDLPRSVSSSPRSSISEFDLPTAADLLSQFSPRKIHNVHSQKEPIDLSQTDDNRTKSPDDTPSSVVEDIPEADNIPLSESSWLETRKPTQNEPIDLSTSDDEGAQSTHDHRPPLREEKSRAHDSRIISASEEDGSKQATPIPLPREDASTTAIPKTHDSNQDEPIDLSRTDDEEEETESTKEITTSSVAVKTRVRDDIHSTAPAPKTKDGKQSADIPTSKPTPKAGIDTSTPIIETCNGYWKYVSKKKTEEDDDEEDKIISRNQKDDDYDGDSQRKNRIKLDTKSGKVRKGGRVSILDLSQE
ncbi:hypothetical protein FQN50_006268 [Emmonsiellopsis sp. PD_5]|nr:hypothetical protein FQN50_006268 [Emmonsiellopsis sp. PD_5]